MNKPISSINLTIELDIEGEEKPIKTNLRCSPPVPITEVSTFNDLFKQISINLYNHLKEYYGI